MSIISSIQDPEAAAEAPTHKGHDKKQTPQGKNQPRSAPNISLNIHSHVAQHELYIVAIFGVLLQTTVLVYAYFSTYNSVWSHKLKSSPEAWAWYCTLTGTLGVVTGMLGCSYIIDKSTSEEKHLIARGEGHILWLQRGETVNDQVFHSHAIFAKDKKSVIMTSRRNDKVTDPTQLESHFFEYGTIASALLSLVGFVVQFMGLRGMHWSVSVAQVGATMVMTTLRAIVRRGLSDCPGAQKLPPGHEMDWLAVRFASCDDRLKLWEGLDRTPKAPPKKRLRKMFRQTPVPYSRVPTNDFWGEGSYDWGIVTGARSSGYEPLELIDPPSNRAQRIVNSRKRLAYLTQWSGPSSDKATSVAAAIEHVMNTPGLFESSEETFSWSMTAEFQGVLETIQFRVDKVSERWAVDLAEIEAVLSLWEFSVDQYWNDDLVQGRRGGWDMRGAWLKSGKASTQEGVRLLGPSMPLSRRDMKWWVSDGAKGVLQVDLSQGAASLDSTVSITKGDYKVVGFGGRELEDGTWNTQPLSEIPIEMARENEVITTPLAL